MILKRVITAVLFNFLFISALQAQNCNSGSIQTPLRVCPGQPVSVSSNFSGQPQIRWSLEGDKLFNPPQVLNLFAMPQNSNAQGTAIVNGTDGQTWHYFYLLNNSLFRVDYPNGLLGNASQSVTIGNPQGFFNGASALVIENVNGNFQGIVVNRNSNSLTALDFGNAPTNLPNVSQVNIPTQFPLLAPAGIEIVKQGSNYFAAVYNQNAAYINYLSFGTSLLNSNPSTVVIPVPGLVAIMSVNFVRDCNGWNIYLPQLFRNEIGRIRLGPDLSAIQINFGLENLGVTGLRSLKFYSNNNKISAIALRSGNLVSKITWDSVLTGIPQVSSLSVTGILGDLQDAKWWTDTSGEEYIVGTSYNSLIPFFQALKFRPENLGLFKSGTNATFNGLKSGNYQLSAEIRYPNGGLIRSITKPLVVEDSIFPAFTAEKQCAEDSIRLVVIANPTVSKTEWNFGNGFNKEGSTATNLFSLPGNYEILVRQTTLNGCVYTSSQTVKVFPSSNRPNSFYSIGAKLCKGTPLILADLSTPAGTTPISKWIWTLSDGQSFSNQNPAIIPNDTGSFTLSLLASDSSGCGTSFLRTFRVLPEPIANFRATQLCPGDSSLFFDASTLTEQTIQAAFWTFEGSSQIQTGARAGIRFPGTGSYNVQYKIVTNSGCESIVSRVVEVLPKPVASISMPKAPEVGSPVYFNAQVFNQGLGLDSIIWSVLTPSGSTLNLGSTLNNILLQPTDSGTYRVNLRAVTASGCVVDTVLSLRVFSACPDFVFSCLADTINIGDPVPLGINNGGGFNIKYDLGAGDQLQNPIFRFIPTGYSNPAQPTLIVDTAGIFGFVPLANDPNFNQGQALLRLDFGKNPESTPIITPLGGFGILNPLDFEMYRDPQGRYYGLMPYLTQSISYLTFVNFNNGLKSVPTSLNINHSSFSRLVQIKWASTPDSLFAFVVGNNSNSNQNLYRLSWLGATPNANPIVTALNNTAEMQANGGLNAIDLVKDCNQWYGALGGEAGGIYLMRFGRYLSGGYQTKNIAASLQQLGISNTLLSRIRSLSFFFEKQIWWLRVTTSNNRGFVIRLGNNPFNDPEGIDFPSNLDNLGLLTALSVQNVNGVTYGLGSLTNLGAAVMFRFPENRINDSAIFTPEPTATPSVRANYAGKFYFAATAIGGNGNSKTQIDSVFVRPNSTNLVTRCFGLQAAAPGFTCSNQRINLSSNFSGANSVNLEWDACPGDLNFNPTVPLNSGLTFASNNVSGLHIAKTGNNYTGFICSRGDGAIFRLDYPGLDVKESPTIVPIPSLTTTFEPYDLRLVKVKTNWILYIAFRASGLSYLGVVNFGTNLLNNSPVINYISLGNQLRRPTGLEVLQEPNQLVLLITSQFSNQLGVLDFGERPLDLPTINTYTIPGATSAIRISALKECNKWGGVIADYTGNSIRHFSFDNGLNQAPTFRNITLPQANINPTCIALVRDNTEYFAVFGAEINQGRVYKVSLGNSILNPSFGPVINTGLVDPSVQFNQGISLIKNQRSEWIMNLAVNQNATNGQRLFSFVFPNNCSVNNPIQTGTSPNFQFASPGLYDICLEGQDNENRWQQTKTIANITNPIIADFVTTNRLCISSPVQFIDRSVSGGGSNPSYEWNFGDTSDLNVVQSNLVNPAHQYRLPGTYRVRLRVRDAGGCLNEKTIPLRIFDLPRPAFTLSENCAGDSITLNDNTNTAGDTLVSWRWELPGVDTVFGSNPRVKIPRRGFYLIKLFVRGRRGCEASDSATQNVSRNAALSNFSWAQGSNCLGDTLKLINSTNLNGTSISSTIWDFGPFGRSTADNPRVFINQVGNWPVKLTISNSEGCTSILTKTISVLPKPSGNIGPLTICERDSIRFRINNSLNIVRRRWFFPDRTTDTNANPLKAFQVSGEYPIKVWVQSANGCDDTLYALILVQPAPTARFTSSGSCQGSAVQFNSSTSSTGGIPGGITAWFWEFAGGQTSALPNPQVFFNTSGFVPVRLTVTAGNCTNTLLQNVRISPKPGFEPNIQVGCDTIPTRFSLIKIRPDTLSQIAWEINGLTYNDTSVSIRLPQSQLPYNVRLSLSNRRGCNAVFSRDFLVGSKPLAHFRLVDSSFSIAPFRLRVVNTSQNANFYKWDFGNGDTSSAAIPNYSFPRTGVYRVRLFAYTSTQCFDVFEKVVSVVPVVKRNIAVKEVRLLQSDSRIQTSVLLENRGTVSLSGIDLLAEFQGGVIIRERFTGPLLPASEAVYNFNGQALQERDGLQIVCVTASITQDDSLADNESCGSLGTAFTVLPVSPNPASVGSQLLIRYSLPNEAGVQVHLVDLLGREALVVFDGVESAGYKEKTISVSALTPGLYSLKLVYQDRIFTQRLVIR